MTLDVITAARRRTRRRLTIAALVVLGVLALIYPAGLYANSRLESAPRSAPATVQAPGPAATTATSVLPADVGWVQVAGVDLPVSATAGPHETVACLARGFAHSRAGVVVAAVHLLVRTTAQVGP